MKVFTGKTKTNFQINHRNCMLRTDIINKLIKKNNYKTYLEIGVRDYFINCDKIVCDLKHSVDPYPQNICDFVMTSDDFFNQLQDDVKYDLIFIDGLHLKEQVDKDIENSLKHLSEGGTIVLHDCLPEQEANQFREPVISQWTGDVWKSIVKLKTSRDDLNIRVVDTDFGCGVVNKSNKSYKTPPVDLNSLDWEWFTENYKDIIEVVSVSEFEKIYL